MKTIELIPGRSYRYTWGTNTPHVIQVSMRLAGGLEIVHPSGFREPVENCRGADFELIEEDNKAPGTL